jgi:SAM-dependent methyltransferase
MNWHARFTQQAGWTQGLRRYLFERSGLSPGQRLLEVGCGTGAVLASLSAAGCRLHGLDINADFLHQAGQNLLAPAWSQGDDLLPSSTLTPNSLIPNPVFLTQADAHHLPYTDGSFDIVFCHFLLLWVHEPVEVIREMRRVTRPGGWVLALAEPDYGGRVDYPEALIQLGELQEEALRRQGAETRLGRRLGALFHSTGLAEVESGVLGGQWREPPSLEDLAQEWAVLQSDLGDQISAEKFNSLQQIDQSAWARGERVLFVPTFYALGRKA